MIRIWALACQVWLEMLRRKDVYVLFVLLAALLAALVSLDVFGLGSAVGYVTGVGLLAAWVLGWILVVSVSTRLLPQEETRGTVYALLAKPVSRLEVLAGKWLGAWAVSVAATLAFYLVVWGVVAWRGGRLEGVTLAQAVLLHAGALGVLAAIGLAFSTRMAADAAATLTYVLTGAAFLVVPRVPAMVMHTRGLDGTLLLALYYALPHLELFDLRRRLVHDWGPAPWTVVLLVLVYGLVVTALVLILGWLGYRRKRFSRETLA
jgi:ABC-type transport system involved in multi-copper enzyme maturation permease subunit